MVLHHTVLPDQTTFTKMTEKVQVGVLLSSTPPTLQFQLTANQMAKRELLP